MITDPQSTTGPVHAAVRNNADWCDAVCRSHGVPSAVDGGVWASPRRTPPLYPDAVTLSPDATSEDVVARIDLASPGASVKDSFGALDLSAAGFEVLFEAQWIHRPATEAGRAPGGWRPVEGGERLTDWEAAWSGDGTSEGLFRAALLVDGAVFLADTADGAIGAGSVAYPGASVVGVSNLFTVDDDLDAAWRSCLEATNRLWPGVPVVGYEHGEALAAAVRQGFEPVGPLRVWLRTDG
ncbi:hypothetical protein [Streptomyces atriruber]|uniref:hypothetical protein n=1 Tax=Streptomyces atriruber TaxID=545121 RepID=UPI000AE5DFA7|nr:hypothetical protein [Streptomyces atriruber]